MTEEARGEAAIKSLSTDQIAQLVKDIDQVTLGKINIRDIKRDDATKINTLMKAFGFL